MTLQTVKLAGRMFAESLMLDTCRIERASTTAPVLDPATGELTTSSPTLIYSGKCTVHATGSAQVVQAGQQPVSLWPFTVAVPFSATGIRLHDIVTVTVSDDTDLLNKPLLIREAGAGTDIVERRLGCEENASS